MENKIKELEARAEEYQGKLVEFINYVYQGKKSIGEIMDIQMFAQMYGKNWIEIYEKKFGKSLKI